MSNGGINIGEPFKGTTIPATLRISRHARFKDAQHPTLWEVLAYWWRSGRKI